ncbi:MAG: phage tail protein [Saprospiraceae bacterium]
MEPFIAEIIMFGGNFAPRGWAFCNGQLLAIAQNTALFSLLGTTYGGDGRTTFALPDLRGRTPIHPGTGPGLRTWKLGERGGTETNTLNLLQLPAHGHSLATGTASVSIGVNQEEPSSDEAAGKVLGSTDGNIIYNNSPADGVLGGGSNVTLGGMSANTGASQPINNIQPSLGINYIIALQGIFPSRS